jgi:hypothetical protein
VPYFWRNRGITRVHRLAQWSVPATEFKGKKTYLRHRGKPRVIQSTYDPPTNRLRRKPGHLWFDTPGYATPPRMKYKEYMYSITRCCWIYSLFMARLWPRG